MTNLPSIAQFGTQLKSELLQARILAFDPGETVGWALMDSGVLKASGQVRTTEFTQEQINDLKMLISPQSPAFVAYESYRVYSWKTDDHAWNEVHTAQIIGVIRAECLEYSIPYVMQTAQVAKQFVTDEKLIAWGLWKKGEKHARDAIRHAVYAALFGKQDQLYGPNGAPSK
jgi:hypothetical protein